MGDLKLEALPQSIEGYADEAVSLSQEDFESRREHPFLLFSRNKLWDRTLLLAQASVKSGARKETQLVNYSFEEGGWAFVGIVRKRQTSREDAGIVLGRVPGNDLIVPVNSISSTHCSFGAPRTPEASWSVTDLGSRNGTYLQEEKLPAYAATPIEDGQYLRLGGNLIAWFFLPGRLWGVLRDPDKLKSYTDP